MASRDLVVADRGAFVGFEGFELPIDGVPEGLAGTCAGLVVRILRHAHSVPDTSG